MKERPISYSGPMVRALLDGRKSQTRRVMVPQPEHSFGRDKPALWGRGRDKSGWANGDANRVHPDWLAACPYGQPGDQLYVREAFWHHDRSDGRRSHRALPDHDCGDWCHVEGGTPQPGWRRFPGMFMPRWASRITLEVTAVRVERVQDISRNDANDEGIPLCSHCLGYNREDGCLAGPEPSGCVADFRGLWDSLNAKRGFGWDANPWVWVIEFRRIESARVAA